MESLLLCIVSSVAFLHIIRLGQHYRRAMVWVGAWNYTTAGTACGLWWFLQPPATWSWGEAIIGSAIGAALVGGYYLIDTCIKWVGVGIALTIERISSVLLPVTASIIFWHEIPTALQALGLLLALLCLPLLTRNSTGSSVPRGGKAAIALVAALLVVTGAIGILYKIRNELNVTPIPQVFFSFVFGTATVISVLVAVYKARRWDGREIRIGMLLGSANLAASYFYAASIAVLPGTIVFPSIAVGVILAGSMAAVIIWKERYSLRILLGMVIAAVALILINIDIS